MAAAVRSRPDGGDSAAAGKLSWLRRVGWLVLLWAGGVVSLGLVALLLKAAMRLVGLTL